MVTIGVLFVILMAASGLTLGRLTGGKTDVSVNAAFAMIVAVSLLGFAFGSLTPDGIVTVEGIKLVLGSTTSLVLGWALGRITSTAGMLPGNGRILKVDRRRLVEVPVTEIEAKVESKPVVVQNGSGKPQQGQGQGKPQQLSGAQLAERLRQERMNRQQETRQDDGGEPVETEPAR